MKQFLILTKEKFRPILLLILCGFVWAPRFSGPIDLRYDAGVYYILGTSISEGKGYRLLNEPGEILGVQYPPVLPLFVAAHQFALGTTDHITVGKYLRVSFFILFVCYILAIYRLLSLFIPLNYSCFVAGFSVFNLNTYFLADLLYSELPYCLLTLLFFMIFYKTRDRHSIFRCGALVCAIYFTRTAGIALLAAWAIETSFRKEYKEMVKKGVITLIPFLLWSGYTFYVEKRDDYTKPAYQYQRASYQFYNVTYQNNMKLDDPFKPENGVVSEKILLERFTNNLFNLPSYIGKGVGSNAGFWKSHQESMHELFNLALLDNFLNFIPDLLPFLMGVIVMSGLLLSLFDKERIIALYVIISFATMLLTPWPSQFSRYLMPVVPFLMLASFKIFLNLREINIRAFGFICRSVSTLVLVVILIVFVQAFKTFQDSNRNLKNTNVLYSDVPEAIQHLFYYDNTWSSFDSAVSWLKNNSSPQDLIITSAPHRVFIKTGLKAVMPPFEPDFRRAQLLIDAVPGDYLIVDSFRYTTITPRYSASLPNHFPGYWQKVYESSDKTTSIYKRV